VFDNASRYVQLRFKGDPGDLFPRSDQQRQNQPRGSCFQRTDKRWCAAGVDHCGRDGAWGAGALDKLVAAWGGGFHVPGEAVAALVGQFR
jgi:hypothetical protein